MPLGIRPARLVPPLAVVSLLAALGVAGCASILGDFTIEGDGPDASLADAQVDGGDADVSTARADAHEADPPDARAADADAAATADTGADGATTTECSPRETAACREDAQGNTIPGLPPPPASPSGLCKSGLKTCSAAGTWGPCVGAVGPKPRDCESPADADCDGRPDDAIDAVCECNKAHPSRTITGAPPSNCQCTETCGSDHHWAVCTPPAACDCTPAETRSCTGASGCAGGTQTCGSDRKWGACNGAPAKATYCLDHDGDGYCAAATACVTVCPGALAAEWKTSCASSDCDDANAAVSPKAPPACKPTNDCHAGTLACAPGGNACTDTGASLPNGTACGAAGVCSQGACGACVTGAARCATSAPETCSSGKWVSGAACSPNGKCTASGTSATCVCNAGYVGNGVTCCLPDTDETFCAKANRTCGALSGTDNCGSLRSVASCGACKNGNACTSGGTCACGTLQGCSGATTCCAGSCVDTAGDPKNCGGCGSSCGAGVWACSNSTCTCSEQVCSGVCTYFSDSANCGKCGNACAAGTACCTDAMNSPWSCRYPDRACLQ